MLTKSQKAGLKNCRNAEQLLAMTQSIMSGTCPFCTLPSYSKPWSLNSGVHWRFKENDYPFPHTRVHLVIASVKHWMNVSHITPEAWLELGEIMARIYTQYGAIEGGIVMRTGSLEYSAGTVEHLHLNVLLPDLTGPVRITIAKEADGSELEKRIRRFDNLLGQLPPKEMRFLMENGIGLSPLMANDIKDS